jgi:exopolyphosphatase/guanosine-5'-triphosphate,3'-diphosphate pyrophosphatase
LAVAAISLDIGCVRLTERFFHHDPPRPAELDEAGAVVRAEVERARRELPPLSAASILIGLAGTVSTLAALDQELARYDRNRIHHAVLGREQVERWLARLSGEDRQARLGRPGMVEGRADVIVGGVVVLAAVMAGFERSSCLVSEDDILDGLAASLR